MFTQKSLCSVCKTTELETKGHISYDHQGEGAELKSLQVTLLIYKLL